MENFTLSVRIALVILALSACQSKSDETAVDDEDTLRLSQAYKDKADAADSINNETFDFSDCVRGPAEQVIKKNISPTSVFELNEDGHTGKETIQFDNGDKVVIRNWGCEYYLLTFRFETERYSSDTTDLSFWMNKAILLMQSIEEGIESPLDIPGGTAKMKQVLDDKKPYANGEEIVYADGEIRQYVTFDRVEKMDNKKYAVEVTYGMGPL